MTTTTPNPTPIATSVGEMVSRAKEGLRALTPDELAVELEQSDIVLVDVREPGEVAEGMIPGAVPAPRGMLEFHADPATPYHLSQLSPERRVVVYCKSGARSALAAATLRSLGYRDIAHLDGGIMAWTDAQRPTVGPSA